MTSGISLVNATLAGDGLARHAHPPAEYKRTCFTRLRDGYLLTYRFVTPSNGSSEAILGVPSFVRIVVPDKGPAVERQLLVDRPESSPFVREGGSTPPRDSASIVIAARRALTDALPVHCLLPLMGGAWVEFVPAGAGVADARGTVVAVNGNGGARVIARF